MAWKCLQGKFQKYNKFSKMTTAIKNQTETNEKANIYTTHWKTVDSLKCNVCFANNFFMGLVEFKKKKYKKI